VATRRKRRRRSKSSRATWPISTSNRRFCVAQCGLGILPRRVRSSCRQPPHARKRKGPRLERGPQLRTKVRSERLDEILFDVLPAVLLGLEPARHPATARPSLARLAVAVFCFHLALARLPHRAVAHAICLP